VFSSLDHVIHAGQKYPFLDWRYLAPFWRNRQKSRKIAKFGLILTPRPANFFGGNPQNFETSFVYYFSGTIARKILDHAA